MSSMSVLPIPDGKTPSAVNTGSIQLRADAPNVAYQGPSFPVGHQGVVRVRAHNGAIAGNVGPVFIGTYRKDVLIGSAIGNIATGYPLTPNTEVTFPVDNLAQIWFSAQNAGDGIQLSVKGAI